MCVLIGTGDLIMRSMREKMTIKEAIESGFYLRDEIEKENSKLIIDSLNVAIKKVIEELKEGKE